MQGIYKIVNKLNRKYYVGNTNNFEKGWVGRRKALRQGNHHNTHLQRAWNKYGEESFAFEIEEEVIGGRAILLEVEQRYLDEGFALGLLYNIARKAGGGNLGEEVNRKISKAKAGCKVSKEHRRKLSEANLGKKLTEETKAKQSMALMGREVTEETRAKIGKAIKKYYETHDRPGKGKHRTEGTRAKIGRAKAKSYPAFYNIRTGEFISADRNLRKLCRERNLNYEALRGLKNNAYKKSHRGWRLATSKEIEEHGTS